MNFKLIINILIVLCCFCKKSVGQNKNYLVAEVEGGLPSTSYNSNVSNSLIDKQKTNFNGKASIGFATEMNKNFLLEAALSQTFRYWNLEGQNNQNSLKIKNIQTFPSVQIGGLYNTTLGEINEDGTSNFSFLAGGKFGFDFINNNETKKQEGNDANYVIAINEEKNKVLVNAILESGIRKNFNSGNQLMFSLRYYLPISGKAITGKAEQKILSNTQEVIQFKANGNYPALAIKYYVNL